MPDFTNAANQISYQGLSPVFNGAASVANNAAIKLYANGVFTLGDGRAVLLIPFTVYPIT